MSLMAADVTSLIRLLSDYTNTTNNNNNKNSDSTTTTTNNRDLVTRDFLGCGLVKSKELDLELKVPSGWERRLDLLSGETYLEKSRSNPVNRELHDLNLPPPPPSAANESSSLDLKLLLPSEVPRSFDYRSVCTLDKVRSALERAGHESGGGKKKGSCGSPSTSTSTSSSSMKRRSEDQGQVEERKGREGSGGLVAAGCPSCLMYVLISKGNPRCPRCDSHVPVTVPVVAKKQKIDLNSLQ